MSDRNYRFFTLFCVIPEILFCAAALLIVNAVNGIASILPIFCSMLSFMLVFILLIFKKFVV